MSQSDNQFKLDQLEQILLLSADPLLDFGSNLDKKDHDLNIASINIQTESVSNSIDLISDDFSEDDIFSDLLNESENVHLTPDDMIISHKVPVAH